ncbi:MAG: SxtJ family membrane protein [Candidatus Omnitrophota bacterium]
MAKPRAELKDLRQFGLASAGIFLALGAVNYFKCRATWYTWFLGLGVVTALMALAAPKSMKPVFIIFKKVGHAIGWINTRIILALIYFLFITPIAIVMKALGKDPLNRKIDKDITSYWVKHAPAVSPKERLEKQF